VAIHAPHSEGDQRNWHAHILTTTRAVTAEGLGAKTRVLDDQKTGPAQVKELRSLFAEMTNQALERQGLEQRVTEKSYASILEEKRDALAQTAEGTPERATAQIEVLRIQTLAENPAPHLGPAVAAIEERERRQAEAESRDYEPLSRIGEEMHRASRVRETLSFYVEAFRSYAREGYAYAAERLQTALSLFGGERREAGTETERGESLAPAAHASREAGGPTRVSQIESAAPAQELRSFLERREAVQARAASPEPLASSPPMTPLTDCTSSKRP